MPLSKKRDRERKRVIRLESKKVQPKWSVNPDEGVKFRSIMSYEDVQPESNLIATPFTIERVKPKPPVRPKRRDQMTAEELGITGHDADGYPTYD